MKLAAKKQAEVEKLIRSGMGLREIGRRLGVADGTVRNCRDNLMAPEQLAAKRTICASTAPVDEPLVISEAGHWLVLSDIHIPHHNDAAVEAALQEAERLEVTGILLNGDILDSAEISRHARHKDAELYGEELEKGKDFLRNLRKRFPNERIIYKEGNHEARLDAYVSAHAPALKKIKGVDVASFLEMEEAGVEWTTSTVIRFGKLDVIHGHETPGGAGGIYPARSLFLKVLDCTMMGHCHRTSQYCDRTIRDYPIVCWTTGCLCDLKPHWCRINKWNLGFATIRLESDGDFEVTNRRVIRDGEIVQ